MAYDIGARVGIEGEKEFKNALSAINSDIRALNSELKAVAAQFDKTDKSEENLTQQNAVYAKSIEAQQGKITLLSKHLEQQRSKLQTLAQALETAKQSGDNNAAAVAQAQAAYDKQYAAVNRLETQLNTATAALNTADRQIKENNQSMQAAREAAIAQAQAQEEAARAAEEMERAQREAAAEAEKLEKAQREAAAAIQAVADKSEQLGKAAEAMHTLNTAALAAGAAVAGVAAASGKVGMDFEASMSNVEALSGATGDSLAELSNKAKELGATTSKSASEAADALGYMALAGWDNQQMLTGLEPILRLSEAAGADLATTSDLVTDSMSALGVKTDDLSRYLDIVAKTQASANTSALGMMEAYIGCGGTMRELEVPLEESAAWIGVLANRGKKASEAGTAFNSIMVNLTGGAGKASEAMETLGISAWDTEGNFKGVEGTLRELKNALANCTEEQKTLFTSAIGGKTQMDTLQALLSGLDEEYTDLKQSITNCDGALSKTAKTMQDNLKGSLTTMSSALEGAGIAFYEKFAEPLRGAVDTATSKISEFTQALSSGELDNTLTGLATGAVAVGTAVAGMNAVLAVKDVANFADAVHIGGEALEKYTAATKAGAAAQGVLNLVQSVSPVGMLAIGVTAVATGLALYIRATGQAETESDRLAASAETLTEKFNAYNEAQNDINTRRNEALSQSDAEMNHLQSMVTELQALADETGRVSTTESDRARVLASMINEIMPGAVQWTEKQGEAYLTTAENLDVLIEKESLKAWLDANAEAYQNAISGQNDLLQSITDTNTQIEQELKNITTLAAQQKTALETGNYMRADELKRQLDEADARIIQSQDQIKQYEESFVQSVNIVSEYEAAKAALLSDEENKIRAALEQTKSDLTEYTGANAAELQKQADDAEANYQTLLQMSKKYPTAITETRLQEAKDLAEKAKILAEQAGADEQIAYASGMESQTGAVETASGATADIVVAQLNGTASQTEISGKQFVNGFLSGLADGLGRIKDAVVNMGSSAVKWLNESLDEHSPSKLTLESGLYFDLGLAKGIEDNSDKAKSAAAKMSKAVLTAANEWLTDQKAFDRVTIADEVTFWEQMKKAAQLGADELLEVEKKLYKAKQDLSKDSYNNSKTWIDNEKFYNRLSAQEEVEAWERVVSRKNLLSTEQIGAEKSLYTARQNLLKEQQDAEKKILDEQKAAIEEYENTLNSRVESLRSFAGLFDEVEKKNDITGTKLLENLQSQVDAFESWQSDMQELSERGVTDALLQELQELGPQAAEEIHALTTLSDKGLQEYADLFAKKGKLAAEQAEKELSDIKPDFKIDTNGLDTSAAQITTTVGAIVASAQSGATDMTAAATTFSAALAQLFAMPATAVTDTQDDTTAAGQDTVSAIVSGITGNIDKITAAATTVAGAFNQQISNTQEKFKKSGELIKDKVKQGITEKQDEYRQNGNLIGDKVVTGISEKQNVVISEAKTLASNFINTVNSYNAQYQSVGNNLMAGVQAGIAAGQSGVVEAIKDALNAAVEAARDAMDINSPSGVYADIGDYMAQGLGVGFVDRMRSVSRQITDSIPAPSFESNVAYNTASGVVNGLASVMQNASYGSGGMPANITVNVQLDNKTIATAILDPLKEVAKQRGVSFA